MWKFQRIVHQKLRIVTYCYAHWQSTITKTTLVQALVTGSSLDHLWQIILSTLSLQDRRLNLFLLFPNRSLQSCTRIDKNKNLRNAQGAGVIRTCENLLGKFLQDSFGFNKIWGGRSIIKIYWTFIAFFRCTYLNTSFQYRFIS